MREFLQTQTECAEMDHEWEWELRELDGRPQDERRPSMDYDVQVFYK